MSFVQCFIVGNECEGCLVKNVFWGGRFHLCVCGLCTGCLHPHAHETFRGLPVGMCGVGAAVRC